jgi:uroporphyrinogen-III synthase
MTRPLEGRTVALAEGRQLEELAQLLQNEGATVLRCPMIDILDAPDAAPVVAWIQELIAGKFGLVVLMTGEALRRLVGFAERAGLREDFVAALGRARTITRGPKPGRALKEVGLAPSQVAKAPTTEGVIATLRDEALSGQTVGVTLFGSANPALEQFLAGAGATVCTVLSYVFAAASDDERVVELVGKLAAGAVDVLIFTSSPQVDRLYQLVGKRGLGAELKAGLEKTCVAAVGPVVADDLRRHGAPVHVCPEQGWVMKNLVQQVKRAVASAPSRH